MGDLKTRRKFLLLSLPFALPLSKIDISLEKKAYAQGDGAALAVMFKEFLDSYNRFRDQFNDMKKTIGSYYDDYANVKRAYDSLKKVADQEKRKFNSFHKITTNPLGVELPDLSRLTNSVFRAHTAATAPFKPLIDAIRKQHPPRKDERLTPSEVKFHESNEARSRHTLGRSEAIHIRDESQKLKRVVAEHASSSEAGEKTAADIFSKEAGPLNHELLKIIAETLIRIEALAIRMDDRLSGIESAPKPFEEKEWAEILKHFREGKGTLLEPEGGK